MAVLQVPATWCSIVVDYRQYCWVMQYDPGAMTELEGKEYIVNFGQIYLSKPTMTEADGETGLLFPKEARLRNLTCPFSLPPSQTGTALVLTSIRLSVLLPPHLAHTPTLP